MSRSEAIDYDKAAADYEASLVTKLRGHGAGSFLENWVPDPDPVLGILNMIEAAWTDGRDELELRVSRKTLDAAGLERLSRLSEAFAAIRTADADGAHRLEVRRVASHSGSGERVLQRAPESKAGSTVRPEQAAGTGAPVPPLHADLVKPLHEETAQAAHEGELQAAAGEALAHARSEQGDVFLAVTKEGVIRAARHCGVRGDARRRLVELMCREIEGRPVQDASDHAAVLAIHRLRLRAGARPIPGVLLATNAGTEVVAALDLVRRACADYSKRAGRGARTNFFEVGASAAWRALSQTQRLERVAASVDTFCREEKTSGAIRVTRLEKDIHGEEIRVIVQRDGAIPADRVPFDLRRLERFLKDRVERSLQVYLEPVKDKNVLRRL